MGGAAAGRGRQFESLDLEFTAGQGDLSADSLPGIDPVIATTGHWEDVPLPEEPPEDPREAVGTALDAISDGTHL